MRSVLQFSCHAWFLFCVYIFVNNIGKVSPYTVYWQSVPRQSVPMHFLLARCPHAFCIGNLSPCIFYWQSVPMHFVLANCPHEFFILWDIFWYCETFFIYSIRVFSFLFFSPSSFLLFLCLFFLFLLQARHGRFREYSTSGQLSSPLKLRAHLCTKVLKMCQ